MNRSLVSEITKRYSSLFLLIIVLGCASLGEQKRLGLLDDTTRIYGNALLWGQYETAAGFLSEREESDTNFTTLKTIKVTAYTVRQRTIAEDAFQLIQNVEIKYYDINNLIEKTVLDKQIWEYNREEKFWYLESGLPKF